MGSPSGQLTLAGKIVRYAGLFVDGMAEAGFEKRQRLRLVAGQQLDHRHGNSSKVTIVETGFPGSPRYRFILAPSENGGLSRPNATASKKIPHRVRAGLVPAKSYFPTRNAAAQPPGVLGLETLVWILARSSASLVTRTPEPSRLAACQRHLRGKGNVLLLRI